MSSPTTSVTNVFDAAKAIVETLQKLDKKETQAQAIRFACESLGLQAVPSIPPTPFPGGQGHVNAPPRDGLLGTPERPKDLYQFTQEKAPKSDTQFAAVVAYYYRFEATAAHQKESITAADLIDAARLAKRARPAKPGNTLSGAMNAGYLDRVGDGQYRLNTVGENLVAVTLPGNGSDKKPAGKN